MVKKRKATMNNVLIDIAAVDQKVFELSRKVEEMRCVLLDEVRTAKKDGQINLDWKQRALDLMLEQANKTFMIENRNNTTRLTWWQSVCAKLAYRFHKLSGKYDSYC